jgi:hypothetical protein
VIGIGGAITSLLICEGCILGKHHVSNFPSKSNSHSIELLKLVHMDLCGPMQTPTHGGAKYFVVFIDDYSQFTIVYFIRKKIKCLCHFSSL